MPAEIVVTAQKRASTVQSTPISITAVGEAELKTRGVVNFTTLAQSTPGVSLKSEGPSQTELELRGMTSSGGNSPTVGFYLDDVPLTAPSSAQNGKVVIDPNVYDLNRVEVLRGPQGTLYGAGSMGGTIRLIANQPNTHEFGATGQAILSGTQGGGFNHVENAMVNLPLVTDHLALRLVGSENYTSGWIDRIVAAPFPLTSTDGSTRGDVADAPVTKRYKDANSDREITLRGSILWKPTDALTIIPSVFFQHNRQNGISAYDSDPGTLAHYQPFDVDEPDTDRIFIANGTITYDAGPVTITSSTAYWRRRSKQKEDASEDFNNVNTGVTYAANNGLPNPGYYGPNGSGEVYGNENDPSHQFSEELRVNSRSGGKLTWLLGAYYSDFGSTWNFAGTSLNPQAYLDLGTFAPATTTHWFDVFSPTTLKQYAFFGDASYAITPVLKADVGLRYYSYNYRYSSSISGWGSGLGAATPSLSGLIAQKAHGVNPKFNLAFEPDADFTLYGTVAKGFRPGGGDAKYPTTGPYWSAVFAPYHYTNGAWPTSYKPDSVWSYEVGEKLRLFDRHLTINSSVYYEDWQHIQLEALPGDWQLNINGDHARIWGAELEIRARLGGGFTLSGSTSYTHARVASGPHWQIPPVDRLSDVTPWTGDIVASYETPILDRLTFTALIENAYVGPRYSLAFPFGYTTNGTYILLPSYDLINARVGIKGGDHWQIELFANNLTDKHAQLESLFQETLPSAAYNRIVTNQPRTFGVDLSFKY
jgi:outer membrane receptor protein involved in Fe transport